VEERRGDGKWISWQDVIIVLTYRTGNSLGMKGLYIIPMLLMIRKYKKRKRQRMIRGQGYDNRNDITFQLARNEHHRRDIPYDRNNAFDP
jgi:hypothetical protein